MYIFKYWCLVSTNTYVHRRGGGYREGNKVSIHDARLSQKENIGKKCKQ